MARFEDRLFSELVEQHGSLLARAPARAPAAPRRRRRAPIAAVALALAVALAALVIGLSRGGGQSAYAVVTNPDGTVTVTISELVGVAPANERLQMLGLPVSVAPVTEDCQASASKVHPADLSPEQTDRIVETTGPAGRASVRVDPAAIPAGDTLLLSANERRHGLIALRALVIEGAAPSCLPPGPGE